MRILLLTKADIQGCLNLNALLPRLAAHDVHVLLSDHLLPGERGNPYADLCTWCDRDFILTHLFPLLDTIRDTTAHLLTFNGLKRKYGVPAATLPHGMRHEFLLRHIRHSRPDVILCCRFDYILKKEILRLPPLGIYNSHSGILPDNCGANAPFRAMSADLPRTACTIHCVTPQIDRGDIVMRLPVDLDYSLSLFRNRMNIYRAAVTGMLRLIRLLENGPVSGCPQDPARYRYYPVPDETAYRAFTGTGKKLVIPEEFCAVIKQFFPAGMNSAEIFKLPYPEPSPCPADSNWQDFVS